MISGIVLMVLIVSNSTSSPKRETNYQNIVYWLEVIGIILTILFIIFIFASSMAEMGYSTESN